MYSLHLRPTTLFVLLFLFFYALPASAQNPKIETLKQRYAAHRGSNKEQVNITNDLAYALYSFNADESRKYAQEALEQAKRIGYKEGQSTSLWICGLSIISQNKQKALEQIEQALKLAEEVKYHSGICNCLIAIGNITGEMGDIARSEASFRRALVLAEKIKDSGLQCKAHINLARTLANQGEHQEAIGHYERAVKLAKEGTDLVVLSRVYSGLAGLYARSGNQSKALENHLNALEIAEKTHNRKAEFTHLINIGGIKFDQNEYDAAKTSINRAYEIAKELKDSTQMSIALTNLGNIYGQQKNPQALQCLHEALQLTNADHLAQRINININIGSIYLKNDDYTTAQSYFTTALQIAEKLQIRQYLGEVWAKMAALKFKQKQYQQAIDYASRAKELGEKLQYHELSQDCYKILANAYAEQGDYKSAYNCHTTYKSLTDSIFNEKNVRNIALMESSYEYQKEKQAYEIERINRELKIKNQRQVILIAIIIALIILLFAAGGYWKFQLNKRTLLLQIKQINREIEMNQQEMAAATLKLVQNAERDSYCVKQLEEIAAEADQASKERARTLANYYKHKSDDQNWEEFETLFTKVTPQFYERLSAQFPTLSPNERKLCVFLKLNMNNKDIAKITFQSDEALKKARLRLRKKLMIDRDVNLSTFLQQF